MTDFVFWLNIKLNYKLCNWFGHKHSDWFNVHLKQIEGTSKFVITQMRYCVRCPYGEEFREEPNGKVYSRREAYKIWIDETLGLHK